tara:strand:- start:58 stop:1248 length:1191 start_codon:yes stop_codon:yes gene_type:complete
LIFQTLDDKSDCVGIYTDGKLHFDDFPSNLTKTWKYTGSITDPNVEYAWLRCGGQSLKQACPEDLIEEWRRLQRRFEAYLKSFRIGKISMREHCFFDLVPNDFLQQFCEAKNQITEYVFENYEKPENYEHLDKVQKLLYKIKYRDLNISGENSKSLFYLTHMRERAQKLLKGSKHIDYNLFGTVTGRLATNTSSFPILTMMRELRKLVKPHNDWFISLDYNGAEARTFLALAGKPQPQEDIHEWNKENVIRKKDVTRDEMKTIFFTWLYSPDDSEILRNNIYDKKAALERHYVDGRVNTPFKRSIIVEERKALNYLVQSTTADLVLDKAVEIDEFLQGKKSFVSHIVHDEIVLDMADDERELIVDIKKMFTENILGNYLVNLKAGKNYLDLEDLKL